eukprot:6315107-Alexandrium_andersonii.AAC.1
MSASLVGSEMCIRDRNMRTCLRRSKLELRGPKNGYEIGPRSSRRGCVPVSYTHLTLPTICSV